MNKIWFYILLLILSNCSLNPNSNFWTKDKKIEIVSKNISKIFEKDKSIEKELNPNLKINIKSISAFDKETIHLSNNEGTSKFNKKNIKKSSKFNFSKIENFNHFEPDLVFDGKNFIFFDNKSNLLKFNEEFRSVWKKNFYNKNEKKLKPVLTLSIFKDDLVVADSIGKIYKVDIVSGKLIWSKTNSNPFNSQLKIYKDKIFVIDINNILRCFSLSSGDELWRYNSENTFLKSNKRNSIAIKDDKIYFSNSLGDLSAINANNGSLIWQIPTQSSSIYEDAFSLKMSDLVISGESLIFSNNRNELYSVNLANGILNWKNKVNSSVRPIVLDNVILTFSNEGFFFVINKMSGEIIRITNIFKDYKKKQKDKVIPIGFITNQKEIILTTNNGRLLIIDVISGKTLSIMKIDNQRISRPFVFNKKILLVKDNSIIKLN